MTQDSKLVSEELSSTLYSTDKHASQNTNAELLPSKVFNEEADEADEKSLPPNEENASEYPSGFRFVITCIAICLAIFLVALDNSIIATAIPKITADFHSLEDVGWYASAYLLTTCAFQLMFGKLYTFYNIKWIFLVAIILFEVGSLVCAVSSNSTILIVGRAIAGLGSAGVYSGAYVIIAHSVPIEKRAVYTGMIGGMFGIASVAGPLMGGAFTDKVSWRWCFYINLPIGGFSFLAILFFFASPKNREDTEIVSFSKVRGQLDLPGSATFLPAIVCILIALQWGGSRYEWSNPRMIVLFVFFGLLMAAFVSIQGWKGETATVPFRIIKKRTMWAAAFFSFCFGGSFYTMAYYLPVWFQAVKGVSAVQSGIRNLPFLLGTTMMSIIAGASITKLGWHTPWAYFCTTLMSVGVGLMTTFEVDSSSSKWIGYQVIYGLGAGSGFQQPVVAVQTVLDLEDTPIGTTIILFAQTFGGAIFVSAANNVFNTHLISGLISEVPSVNPRQVADAGATNLQNVVPSELLPAVLVVYNDAVTKTFEMALILSCMSLIGAVFMEHTSVKSIEKSTKPRYAGTV